MRTRTTFLGAVLLLGSIGAVGAPSVAHAEAPPNDNAATATEITSVPFFDEVDTTDATTSMEETALNEFCGAPAVEHAVWYRSTATSDGMVVVDTTSSDFSAGILVLEGEPGSWLPITCMQGSFSGPVTAGETYYMMVFGDGTTTPPYGTLRFEIRPAAPPPEIEVTVNPIGYVDKAGGVTVSGTASCTTTEPYAEVSAMYGELRQRVGRFFVTGWFDSYVGTPCDGTAWPWAGYVNPGSGRFAGGKAAAFVVAFGCGTDNCSEAVVETTIKLRRGRPPTMVMGKVFR